MNFKRKLAILTVPAVLAVGGGALAVHAASTPSPSPASSQKESATEPADKPEATSATDPVEPAGTDGPSGHADAGDQVDHQSTGNE
jgi:hypothetical protein